MQPYYEQDGITIYHGRREDIPITPDVVDLLLSDPPYAITANDWDKSDPAQLATFFRRYRTVVITASQPFSSLMVCADLDRFRHEWVWQKNQGSNFANTVREPMKEHEVVLVFSDKGWTYNKQMQERNGTGAARAKHPVAFQSRSENYREFEAREHATISALRVPSSIQKFNREVGLHPTQKPVPLFEYLVRTYSNEGDMVFDPYAGSGTTLLAAMRMGRKAIGIEQEEKYCEIAVKRLQQSVLQFSEGGAS